MKCRVDSVKKTKLAKKWKNEKTAYIKNEFEGISLIRFFVRIYLNSKFKFFNSIVQKFIQRRPRQNCFGWQWFEVERAINQSWAVFVWSYGVPSPTENNLFQTMKGFLSKWKCTITFGVVVVNGENKKLKNFLRSFLLSLSVILLCTYITYLTINLFTECLQM